MSKLIACLLDSYNTPTQQRQARFKESDLIEESKRIYNASADQMRHQRQGLSQDYATIQRVIQFGIAARVTQELAKMNLRNRRTYIVIIEAITAWNLNSGASIRECQAVKQGLLSCLPAARQAQQLHQACCQYKAHLALDIEAQLLGDHPQIHQQYVAQKIKTVQSLRGLDRFITTHLQSESLPESDLKKTITKYEAVTVLQKTLQTGQSAIVQVQNFNQALAWQKPILEKHRDSVAMRFLKVVATIITLGGAACFGLWSVRGQAAAERMQDILDSQTTPTPTQSSVAETKRIR